MTTYREMFRESLDFALTVACEERDFEKARLNVAIAQAMATDELANQQCIANLIALSESGRTTVNGARAALSALYDGSVEDGSANMRLRPDVADALGIEEEQK